MPGVSEPAATATAMPAAEPQLHPPAKRHKAADEALVRVDLQTHTFQHVVAHKLADCSADSSCLRAADCSRGAHRRVGSIFDGPVGGSHCGANCRTAAKAAYLVWSAVDNVGVIVIVCSTKHGREPKHCASAEISRCNGCGKTACREHRSSKPEAGQLVYGGDAQPVCGSEANCGRLVRSEPVSCRRASGCSCCA